MKRQAPLEATSAAVNITPEVKIALDRAVHEAVQWSFLRQGFGQCACYALIGAELLTRVTGHTYRAVCGGEIIDCGEGIYLSLYPDRETRRKARHIGDLREYHCWIESWHLLSDGKKRLEIIDLTARHDHLTATYFGVEYRRPYSPNFIWDWADQISATFPESLVAHHQMTGRPKAWYWADKHCTDLLQKWSKSEPGLKQVLLPNAISAFDQLRCQVQAEYAGDPALLTS